MSSSANLSDATLSSLEGPFNNAAFRQHQLVLMHQIEILKKERQVFEQELLAEGFNPQKCLTAFECLSKDEQRDINAELGLAAPDQAPLALPTRLPRRRSFL
ncbi:hypothetical protein HC248_03447 [Polaromonas vacuolata]|uniref:Uncharacterized protein n=1 Tax=Polaromonas vacuolata TaxID=37448 RepID=A0A6H2HE54_9BURK|nr:hypothetical protein [Polaromonas vacuolata]QJC58110.1 hypothetical protein HC248_03447 [Polaromonas vacuolata]